MPCALCLICVRRCVLTVLLCLVAVAYVFCQRLGVHRSPVLCGVFCVRVLCGPLSPVPCDVLFFVRGCWVFTVALCAVTYSYPWFLCVHRNSVPCGLFLSEVTTCSPYPCAVRLICVSVLCVYGSPVPRDRACCARCVICMRK